MCAFACMHMHAHIHTHEHIYTDTGACIYIIYACTNNHIHAQYTHTHLNTHAHTCMHARTHTCTHTRMHARMHAHTDTHTQTHTRTCTLAPNQMILYKVKMISQTGKTVFDLSCTFFGLVPSRLANVYIHSVLSSNT